MAAGDIEGAERLQAEARELGDRERELDARYDDLGDGAARTSSFASRTSPAPDAPDGAGPDDNVVLRVVGYDPDAYGDHQRVPHWDIAAELGLLDPERAAKLSGSMFVLYRGMGARLLRALTQLALDRHTSGLDAYEEIRPPTLVRTDTMVSTGHLPKFDDDAYHLERDDLWAIPTAEVPLTSLHRDEILEQRDLPQRFCAYTPCFRREAGSAGADTRGVLRSHEFDKVELFAYCTPDQAADVHADILSRAESSARRPRTCRTASSTCAPATSASRTRAPSTSRCTRRVAIAGSRCRRCRGTPTSKPAAPTSATARKVARAPRSATPSTVRRSAWPRIWAALLETNRQPDGSIALPEGAASVSRRRRHHSSLTAPEDYGPALVHRFWSRLAVELGKRAGLVSVIGLLVTLILGFGITRLDFATGQDSYLNKSDQVYKDNVAYQGLFGGQAMLTVITMDQGHTVDELFTAERPTSSSTQLHEDARRRPATTRGSSRR